MVRTVRLVAASYVVIAGLVLGLGWLVTHPLETSVDGFDDDVARWFADQRTPGLDRVAEVGTFLGDTVAGLVLCAVLAVVAGLLDRSWRGPLLVLLAVVGHFGIYLLATHVDPRSRPPVPILDPGLVPSHSFPSGHVGTAVTAWGLVVLLLALRVSHRAWRRVLLTLLVAAPVVVALARLYQGAHHLTDVTTSLLYASAWLLVVATALRVPRH